MILRTAGSIAVLALALLAAGCGGGQQIAPGVTVVAPGTTAGPGQTVFSISNVNPEHWTQAFRQGLRDGQVRYGYTCKVLYCPEPATIVISHRAFRGPPPTRQQLEKIAKETLPKLIEARNLQFQVQTDNKGKIERLSSGVTKLGKYEAILQETKTTLGDRSRVSSTSIMVAGKLIITIFSEAGDRATARRSIDEFVTRMTVEEGPQS
jgi:hypothetical protein